MPQEARKSMSAGGARQPRLLAVGQPDAVPPEDALDDDLAREVAEVRVRLSELEHELETLRQHGDEGGHAADALEDARPPPHRLVELSCPRLEADRDYWLCRCEGFAVRAGGRLVGRIEGVRFESRTDRPDLLEVRRGRLGRRLLLVPVAEVEAVQPDERVVALAQGSGDARGGLRGRLVRFVAPLHPIRR